MDDKRTAFAILLIIVVVMVYSEVILSPYTRRGQPATPPTATSQASAGEPSAVSQDMPSSKASTADSLPQSTLPPPGHPTPAELKAHPQTTIETSKVLIAISHLGARLAACKLKDYRAHLAQDTPLDLVSTAEGTPLPLALYSGGFSDEHSVYTLKAVSGGLSPENSHFNLAAGQELVLNFAGRLPDNREVNKIFTFSGDSYLFKVKARLEKPAADGSSVWLEWTHYLHDPMSTDRLDPLHFTALYDDNKVRHKNPQEIIKESANGRGLTTETLKKVYLSNPFAALWGAFDDKYFAAILIPAVQGQNLVWGFDNTTMLFRARGSEWGGEFSVFVGPKQYQVLRALNLQLERSIDLGFFAFLAYPMLLALRFFNQLLNNYGLAIVLLTLTVRALFLPLNQASLKSMQAMQELQPEIKALRERIKDPNLLNQEMLSLYKKRGVNPMGGCLPIVIQIPVFFGLYSALANAIELRHAPFALWINDLSAPERLTIAGINFPVMTLLMGAIMFLQQYLTPNPSMDPAQRKTMLIVSLIFPVMFLVYPFPAGLALYILVSTTIGVIQQAYLKEAKGTGPLRATAIGSVAIFLVAFILTKIK